ncbi:hypothetical protein KQI38_13750 [Tissierella carlieri]|jgi:hypothetical protein|uniref:hypothetical protein n=1 Tax=Tissierella carlieri TaxID=689904 RepID=UPI001C1262DA|nr:hypothetical protein [Tissierella carlieri]MBU5313103.1 hypothetical protein [Tissierella carlieri]
MYRRNNFLIATILILFLLSGCNNMNFKGKDFNYKYGVIETTGQENNSYISFYDDNLEKTGEEKIKYGSMGDGFSLPQVFKNSMFIVPKGLYSKKELTFIMEYDLDKMKIKKYNTGLQNMNSIAVDDSYIYGVNTMNFVSNIVRCNRETKKLSKVEIPNTYISYIEIYENELFAFGESNENGKMNSSLYILDADTLNILEKIDITDIGFGQYDTVMKDNKLYFSASHSIEGTESQPINKLCEYNRESGEVRIYDLKENFPFQIMGYNDKLLITHFDPVGVIGNKISIFNVDDKNSDIVEFTHNIEQLELDDEDIIILGDGYLYRYDKNFSLKDSTLVVNERETDYHYYTTGLFKP